MTRGEDSAGDAEGVRAEGTQKGKGERVRGVGKHKGEGGGGEKEGK